MTREHLLTVDQAAELGNVSRRTVEAWILQERLPIVQRRKGRVYVAKGKVLTLVNGICEHCGAAFRRANLRQRFCSQKCRQASSRLG